MTLNEYLHATRISNSELVKALERYGIQTTAAQIHQLRYGRRPGPKMAKAIEIETRGLVTLEEQLKLSDLLKAV